MDKQNYATLDTRYNLWKGCIIKEHNGEEFCPKCKGSGLKYHREAFIITSMKKCSRCGGLGKIDWITKIMSNGEK